MLKICISPIRTGTERDAEGDEEDAGLQAASVVAVTRDVWAKVRQRNVNI